MRPLRLALVLLASVALTGCVSTASLESEQPPAPERTWAQTVEADPADVPLCAEGTDDWFPVEESIDGMPGVDLGPEYSAVVVVHVRGEGACAPAATEQTNTWCEPALGLGDESAVLAGPTVHMFAAGASLQVTADVSGRTTTDERFSYGMAAWRFSSAEEAQAAPLLDAIAACDGVIETTGDAVTRSELRTESDPYLRLTVDGDRVFLFRSLELMDGSGLSTTTSGLLPSAAVDHIEQWWLAHGTDVEPREP